ncbi:hypothetical protein TNCV_1852361 [Trichonephila clavipes]|nr:hypothetical protein TNCV_1852361 [Trichonephila clavipes]
MHIGSGNEPKNKDVRYDVEEHYTEGDYFPQNKADSENYFAEDRHDTSLDVEKKGNFYHRSNSDTRGRRFGLNSYEKYKKNENYQDSRRQNYNSDVNNKSDYAQISNESLNEATESISVSDNECFQNNKPECDDKDESKRQDIRAGNSFNGAFFYRQRINAYRFDTHFQDGRRDSFEERETK